MTSTIFILLNRRVAIARILQDRTCVILSPMRRVVSNDQLSICLWTATIQSFLWCVSRWWILEWPCSLWRVSKQSTLDRHSLQSLWRSVWIMFSEKSERERQRKGARHTHFFDNIVVQRSFSFAIAEWRISCDCQTFAHAIFRIFLLLKTLTEKTKWFELLLARPQKQLTTDGLQFVEQTAWCEHNKTCRESEYTCFYLI